ncbi:MAG: hypothetical protein H0W02_05725 [Ktedonobacteraceae bacterium]|nr:hypothetical protein [Ktedonobacteraceae bacterium]
MAFRTVAVLRSIFHGVHLTENPQKTNRFEDGRVVDAFLLTAQIPDLLQTLQAIDTDITSPPAEETRKLLLKPEDLTLVCFDYIWQ